MDPPDLFSDLYDESDDEEPPRMPQERRSQPRPTERAGAGAPAPRVKDSSVRTPTTPVMAQALAIAANRGDVVTSGSEGYAGDGVHKASSQHYTGTAFDVRYASNRARQVEDYKRSGLVVIPEKDHIHIQAYPVSA